jgi:hypothetical protein
MDLEADSMERLTNMARKTYRKPELTKLGLLRKLTRMSW